MTTKLHKSITLDDIWIRNIRNTNLDVSKYRLNHNQIQNQIQSQNLTIF